MEIKRARLQNIKQMKVNITAGMDIKPDQSQFIIVSRYKLDNSTINHYQLQSYSIAKLNRTLSTYIYSSYNQQNHPCKYMPDGKTIVVVTINHIIFYDSANFKQKHKQLHGQLNVYDVQASPDSRLIALVGNSKILIWDTVTYDRVIFINQKNDITKNCKFSTDGQYFGFVSDRKIKMYKIKQEAGTYLFDQTQTTNNLDAGQLKLMQSFGDMSTFDFNPTNNREIVIGFSDSSPRKFNFDTKNIMKIAKQEQPSAAGNFKVVKYFPDGKRIFSGDHKDGIGYWPGIQNSGLVYKQQFFMLDFRLFQSGRRIIGRVWQTINFIQVQFQCLPGKFSAICQCGQGQYWDMSSQYCRPCVQADTNVCLCSSNQIFKPEIGGCIYDCSKVTHSINNLYSYKLTVPCSCDRGYLWKNGQCIFDCSTQGTDFSTIPETCQCKTGFVWNSISKRCQCPPNNRLVKNRDQQPFCQCIQNYQLNNQTGLCTVDCTQLRYTNGSDSTNNSCICNTGFNFLTYDNQTEIAQIMRQSNYSSLILGAKNSYCALNCSAIPNTEGLKGFDECFCAQNMIWNGSQCILNCKKIKNGFDRVVINGTQSCTCSLTYSWVPQNKQCGRNCDGVPYVNHSKFSTADSCPCTNNFDWSLQLTTNTPKCIINCQRVNFSQPYSIGSTSKCSCRTLFLWDENSTKCLVNCSQIWDAGDRVNDGTCDCKNDKIFNQTSMTCVVKQSQAIFSRPWVWAVLGIGSLFVIIVAAVMIRFCWKFKTDKQANKQREKTLKKNTEPKVRKKKVDQINEENIIASSQRAQLNKY